MTSLERELSMKVPMGKVREAVRAHMEDVFGFESTSITLEELKRRLDKS